MVKIELGKRDFVWMGLLVVLIGVGFVYAYGTSDPAVFGHSGGELEIVDTNTNAITLCPNNQFLDGDGSCRTTAQIVADGGGSTKGTLICTTATWDNCPVGYIYTGNWDTNWAGSSTKIRCCKII